MARPLGRLDTDAVGHEVPPAPPLEMTGDPTEERFLAVLKDTVATLESEHLPYAVLGGIASSVHGRYRWTHDIDLLVREDDADAALDALLLAGFTVQRLNPHWLYKAAKDDVLVDVLFRSKGDLTYDGEMIARTRVSEFKGVRIRVLAPEDLLVIKATVHDEQTPRHWHDALGILKASDLDWNYLIRRARVSPRRVLSLLLYAQSEDHVVPNRVIRELTESVLVDEETG